MEKSICSRFGMAVFEMLQDRLNLKSLFNLDLGAEVMSWSSNQFICLINFD